MSITKTEATNISKQVLQLWFRLEYWNIHEACSILSGFDPKEIEFSPWEFPNDLYELYFLMFNRSANSPFDTQHAPWNETADPDQLIDHLTEKHFSAKPNAIFNWIENSPQKYPMPENVLLEAQELYLNKKKKPSGTNYYSNLHELRKILEPHEAALNMAAESHRLAEKICLILDNEGFQPFNIWPKKKVDLKLGKHKKWIKLYNSLQNQLRQEFQTQIGKIWKDS